MARHPFPEHSVVNVAVGAHEKNGNVTKELLGDKSKMMKCVAVQLQTITRPGTKQRPFMLQPITFWSLCANTSHDNRARTEASESYPELC